MSDFLPIPPELSPEELTRARELLPWYANGSIDAEDHAWLTAWLNRHQDQIPEMITELNWLRQTAQQVKDNIHLPEPTRGLDTLLSRIQSEQTSAFEATVAPIAPPVTTVTTAPTPPARPKSKAPSIPAWWLDLQDHMRQLFTRPMLATALAIAFLLQLTIIGALMISRSDEIQQAHDQSLTPLSGNVTAPKGMILLQVAFFPDAPESAIRELLVQANASIIAGPGALGIYTLSIPKDQAASARQTLEHAQQQHHVIDSVQGAP